MQDTRIRVLEKESAGHKSRSLSIINPSPEGSQSIVFTTDTREALEDWVEALHQHHYDQSECYVTMHHKHLYMKTRVYVKGFVCVCHYKRETGVCGLVCAGKVVAHTLS